MVPKQRVTHAIPYMWGTNFNSLFRDMPIYSDICTGRTVRVITVPVKSHMLQVKGYIASNSLDMGFFHGLLCVKTVQLVPTLPCFGDSLLTDQYNGETWPSKQ